MRISTEIHNKLGLRRTRQQGHTPNSIHPAMVELRAMYPDAGVREMIGLLFYEHNMSVSKYVLQQWVLWY
jgi:hypothetical protein